MTQFTSPKYLISILDSGSTVALTAPLVLGNRVQIGLALSPEEAHSVDLALNEFIALSASLYFRVATPRVFHGLKRIWEYLDERCLRPETEAHNRIDIHKIENTRLMAYLLDPDSSREMDFGEYRVQEELGLAHLAQRYLGRDYPYRITAVCDGVSTDLASEALAHDPRLIWELGEKLPSLMSRSLRRLYRDLELPLMVLLDDMRRIGIGFDGVNCGELADETERSMTLLAPEITGGADVDLTSHEEVSGFLAKQGVPLQLAPAYARRKGLRRPLEQIAHAYPIVRRILHWWDLAGDLGFLRRWSEHSRIHPTGVKPARPLLAFTPATLRYKT